ncbi:hypothetical protein Tco_0696903 [Tanacetum coccineum]
MSAVTTAITTTTLPHIVSTCYNKQFVHSVKSHKPRVWFKSVSKSRRKRGVSLFSVSREIADARVSDNNVNTRSALVEIPVTCYQLLGIPDKSEKDEIVKSMKHLKIAEIEEGYTMDTIVSRQNLLMDVRDKLLFEADYAGNVRDKVPPKSSLQIPWSWLPGALCLLQEVERGETVTTLS